MGNKNQHEEYTLLLGKGFALDVYLPSLTAINCKKIALEKSSQKLINFDIDNLDIKWVNENNIINNKFYKIIIAEPPEKQFKYICEQSLWKNTDNIILEKPLAIDSKKAKYLINILNKNKSNYSVNYTFRYTEWFKKINNYLHNNNNKEEISISWKFKARHLQKKESSWKTNGQLGGGAVKYYGIHLIAILSDIGYFEVNKTKITNSKSNQQITWSCELNSTNKLPKLSLFLDSYSNQNQFYWHQKNQTLLDLDSPFSLESSKYNGDLRIPPTIKFLKEKQTDLVNVKNMNALELWSNIESKT